MQLDITILYKEYYPKLLYYAYKFLPYDRQKAEEIVDDVFVAIHKGKLLFTEGSNNWLYTCVKHKCLNEIERNKHLKICYTEIEEDTVNEDTTDYYKIMAEVTNRIMQNIEMLAPRQQMVIKKRYLEGCSLEETAYQMGIAIHTVKALQKYAVKQLKMDLGLAEDARLRHKPKKINMDNPKAKIFLDVNLDKAIVSQMIKMPCTPLTLRPRKYLHENIMDDKYICSVQAGILKSYINGKIVVFYKAGDIFAVDSYLNEKIETIDNCTLLFFKLEEDANAEIRATYYSLLSETLKNKFLIQLDHSQKQAKERLRLFRVNYADLIGRLKQKDIGSFLGITEQTYSRNHCYIDDSSIKSH